MQLPAWKPAELLQCLGGFEGEEKLAPLDGPRGRHTLGVTVFVELPWYSVSEVRTRIRSKTRGSFSPTPRYKNRQFDTLRAFSDGRPVG
jgi:hypothetical protein